MLPQASRKVTSSFEATSLHLGDLDGDGDADLLVGASPSSHLYRNDGTTFTEVTASPGGTGEEASTLAVAWWDFDDDGRPDLWSANDFGMTAQPNQLWRNKGDGEGTDPLPAAAPATSISTPARGDLVIGPPPRAQRLAE